MGCLTFLSRFYFFSFIWFSLSFSLPLDVNVRLYSKIFVCLFLFQFFFFFSFAFAPNARVSAMVFDPHLTKTFAKMLATSLSIFSHSFYCLSLTLSCSLFLHFPPSIRCPLVTSFTFKFRFKKRHNFFFLFPFTLNIFFLFFSSFSSHLSRSAVLLVKHGRLSDIPGGSWKEKKKIYIYKFSKIEMFKDTY